MVRKKKVSIDFTVPEYDLLVRRAKNKGCSNSTVINDLINVFLRLSPEVTKKIGNYCYCQYLLEKEHLEDYCGYERNNAMMRMDQYHKISTYLGYDASSMDKNGMRIIFLADGYVTFPKDWIILDHVFGSADTCRYAGVVECRNADKYGVPHFIFFSNIQYARDYTDEMEACIYAACARAYPDFRRCYNLQLPYPGLDDKVSLEQWNNAPCFQIFHIVEKGDPICWPDTNPDYTPPYGAMIIRESNDNNK